MTKQSKRVRGVLGAVVLVTAVYFLSAWAARPVPNHPFFNRVGEEVLVIAHQGGEHLWPSNTMLAFENAVALGVDVLEMDMHATADGVLVLMHDATVDRTTDGSGAIKEMTYAQIQTLDAGYYWTSDDGATYPFRGQGIQVPTVESLFQAFPDMPMNIEIKQQTPDIVPAFCQMLRDYAMTDKVLVATFHADTVKAFRERCPEVATSMVEPEIRWLFGLNLAYLGALFFAPAEAIQVPEYFGDLHVLTPRFVRSAHGHNIEVHAWTINDVETMQRLIDAGVNGLITDRPDLALALLGRE